MIRSKFMKKERQIEEELKSRLKEQILFLSISAKSYDKGLVSEAKRLALAIRTLFHDTSKSTSLLKHLNKKETILLYDTSLEYEQDNLLPYTGLVTIDIEFSHGKSFAKFHPVLDGNQKAQKKINFKNWWNETIIDNKKGDKLTREDLILFIANQDGGAHVDTVLPKKYENLTRFNSLGIEFSNMEDSYFIDKIELANVRQISHEVLKSLRDEFAEDEFTCFFDYYFNNKEELDSIIEAVENIYEYKPRIDIQNTGNALNIDSIKIYIKTSETVKRWIDFIQSLNIEIGPMGNISRDIEMISKTNIKSINELDELLKNSETWAKKYLEEFFHNTFGHSINSGECL
jgi:hypothetical protein